MVMSGQVLESCTTGLRSFSANIRRSAALSRSALDSTGGYSCCSLSVSARQPVVRKRLNGSIPPDQHPPRRRELTIFCDRHHSEPRSRRVAPPLRGVRSRWLPPLHERNRSTRIGERPMSDFSVPLEYRVTQPSSPAKSAPLELGATLVWGALG